jgi:hypothetical protein
MRADQGKAGFRAESFAGMGVLPIGDMRRGPWEALNEAAIAAKTNRYA